MYYMSVLSRIEGEKNWVFLSYSVTFLFSIVGVLFALYCLVYIPQSKYKIVRRGGDEMGVDVGAV